MAGKSVNMGKEFERETAALAGQDPKGKPYGRRIWASGAIGTVDGTAQMVGDARWEFPWFNKRIISIECKHGYGDKKTKEAKSIRIQREWFDKHLEQCKAHDLLPAFAFKIKFTQQNGLSKFMLIPFPVMQEMIKTMEDMYLENVELTEENAKLKRCKKEE